MKTQTLLEKNLEKSKKLRKLKNYVLHEMKKKRAFNFKKLERLYTLKGIPRGEK